MKSWQQRIEQAIKPLPTTWLPTSKSIGRIPAQPLISPLALPRFSESLRDGFLLYLEDVPAAQDKGLAIKSEIAAGTKKIPPLKKQEAHRIFTGGRIPVDEKDSKDKRRLTVVPYEWCEERNGRLFICQYQDNRYIFYRGEETACGEKLAEAGAPLTAATTAKMMAVELAGITVYRRAKIAVCCTGSELVHRVRHAGEKISVNECILKEGLRPLASKISTSLIADNATELHSHLQQLLSQCDLLITSGGTGSGKYDLMRATLESLGAEVILDQLPFRPGRILFARLPGKRLHIFSNSKRSDPWIIALPGTPQAVATLLYELVIPVANLLQGSISAWPKTIMAELLVKMEKKTTLGRMKSGVLEYRDGRVGVRPAEDRERSNCRIFYPPQKRLSKNGLVEVHL